MDPVSICTTPNASNLPWYNIKVRYPNIAELGSTEGLLIAKKCNPFIYTTFDASNDMIDSYDAMWKVVPSNGIFTLLNRTYGVMNRLSSLLAGGFGLSQSSSGILMPGLRISNIIYPGQWYKISIAFAQPIVLSYLPFQSCKYMVGTGGTLTLPLPGPVQNELEFMFDPIDPEYAKIPITDGKDKNAIIQCLTVGCNSEGSFPKPCYDYLVRLNDPEYIKALLADRCINGTQSQVLRDPACNLYCDLGKNDQLIRQNCIAARQQHCTNFYDPASNDLWASGTPYADKRACSCFMPRDFYVDLTNDNVQGTNPKCYYSLCNTSPEGSSVYNNSCNGVTNCYQAPNQSTNGNCFNTETPENPGNPSNPGNPGNPANPQPPNTTPTPPASSWVWIVTIIIIILITVSIIVFVLIRKNNTKQSSMSNAILAALVMKSQT